MGMFRRCTRRSADGKVTEFNANKKVFLRRELGILRGVAVIAGSMIGSGIFISPKGVLLHSGSVGASLTVWIACGIFSGIGALSYAEIGLTVPKSGGIYTYCYEAFGSVPAFLIFWTDLVLRGPTSQCIAALAIVKYMLSPMLCSHQIPTSCVKLFAISVLVFLTTVNALSVNWTARLQNLMFYIKILLLVIIIAMGFFQLSFGFGTEHFDDPFAGTERSVGELGLAMYNCLFAYAGWESLNYAAEEVKNQEKTLPWAIYISVALVTVVYTLANVAYFVVLGKERMLSSDAVAVSFIKECVGMEVGWIVQIGVMCSITGALTYSIFGSSRLYFVGARDYGHLPSIIGMINVNRLTPLPAIVLNTAITIILLLLFQDDIYLLLNYYGFFRWILGGSGVLALVVLRYRQPDLCRPIKFPIFIHIIFLILCAGLVITPVYLQPLNSFISMSIMLTGIPVYFIFIHNYKKPACYYRTTEWLTKSLQKLMNVRPQDEVI